MDEPTTEAVKTAGQKLREDLHSESDSYATALLVEQAAEIADWLARLSAIVDGKEDEWARLTQQSGATVIVVDNAIREARALSGELRQLLSAIDRRRAGAPTPPREDDLANL